FSFTPTLVATRRSGNEVIGGELESVTGPSTTGAGSSGSHSEQNMWRLVNSVPSLPLRLAVAVAAVRGAAGRAAGLSLSVSAAASTTWPTAVAASAQQMTTTMTPSSQKYFLM